MKCPVCRKRAIGLIEWGRDYQAFGTSCDHCSRSLRGGRWVACWLAVCLLILAASLPVVIWLDSQGIDGLVAVLSALALAMVVAAIAYAFGEYELVVEVSARLLCDSRRNNETLRDCLARQDGNQVIDRLRQTFADSDTIPHGWLERVVDVRFRTIFNHYWCGGLLLLLMPIGVVAVILIKDGTLAGIGWPLAALAVEALVGVAILLGLPITNAYYVVHLDDGTRWWIRPN